MDLLLTVGNKQHFSYAKQISNLIEEVAKQCGNKTINCSNGETILHSRNTKIVPGYLQVGGRVNTSS